MHAYTAYTHTYVRTYIHNYIHKYTYMMRTYPYIIIISMHTYTYKRAHKWTYVHNYVLINVAHFDYTRIRVIINIVD